MNSGITYFAVVQTMQEAVCHRWTSVQNAHQ